MCSELCLASRTLINYHYQDPDWEDQDNDEPGTLSQDLRDVHNRDQVAHRTVSDPSNPYPLLRGRFVHNKTKRERWRLRVLRRTKTAKVGRKGFRGATKKTTAKKRQIRFMQRRAKRYKGLAKRYKRPSNKAKPQ
jgi:hypothetical protein